jgi:cytochrome c oxidase assembly protein subunit 15
MQSPASHVSASPWPHRWAVALACATFPLLWVGGLVTTTDAGMAVPDWPTTFGYNLFLYPWTTWLAAPWDLFVEHGHRLLGAIVGMITIALMFVIWRNDNRRWMRLLSVAALALVIVQGVLGGMRVEHDSREFAMIHGFTGPLFFAVTIAMVVFTSRRWRDAREPAGLSRRDEPGSSLAPIRMLATITCVLVYLQLLLGAVVRHVPVVTEPNTFAMAVRFHLFLAAVLTLHIIALIFLVRRRAKRVKPLAGLATTLGLLVFIQLLLGMATWLAKFAVPAWASGWISHENVTIADGGWLQTHIITAHVAVGSLLLATSLALALYAQRLLRGLSSFAESAEQKGTVPFAASKRGAAV